MVAKHDPDLNNPYPFQDADPRAETVSADIFAEYRTKELDAGIRPNTLNRRLAYMRVMFNELDRLEHWKKGNPLKKVRAFDVQERELSFLRLEQIPVLFEALSESRNEHTPLIATICLATGARWSEGDNLRITQLQNERIQLAKTKSGKVRAVPISSGLAKRIKAHYNAHGSGDRIFGSAYSAFREAIARAKIIFAQRAAEPRFATHLCQPLYDGRTQHSYAPTDTRP